MVTEDLYERITRVETIVSEHSRKLDAQVEKNDTLTKLATIMEMQVEVNKEQSIQMKKFDITLNKVNTNLDGLNKNLETLDTRVGKLESNDNERKIDVPSLMTKIVVGIFMTIPTLITMWLALQFGLK